VTEREFWTVMYRALAMMASAIKTRYLAESAEKVEPQPIKRLARLDR
jgi:hypothetical protein